MPRQANLFRKPTPQDFYTTLGRPSARTLNTLRKARGLNDSYPLYKLPPKDLEDRLGHTLEEISLALNLDALTIQGRHDGRTFVKSSKPVALFNKARQHAREASRYFVYLRLYRRDLIDLLDNPCTEDEVYLCETEYHLSLLFDKINHLKEDQISRLEARYREIVGEFADDIDLFAKFIKHQPDTSNNRREAHGKPSLPDMAVYTSLYDVLGFGHYNRPLGDGKSRYESARDKFPESLGHLGLGPKTWAAVPQNMYSDLLTLPKEFRRLERFMEGIHRRYQLPRLTSYRSGMYFPTESHKDEVVIEGQGFYKNSLNSPKLFHRGILQAILNSHDKAMREVMRHEGDHRSLLTVLKDHGILDEVMQPGFDLVINKILTEGK